MDASDYLKAEATSEVRHEHIAGDLYAMAGASEHHNFISGISESTRGTDEREKLLTFIQLPSLEEYVLI